MALTYRTASPQETKDFAAKVAGLLRDGDLVVLSGEMGAGKTCLTQGVAKGLGIEDRVTSPTFTLANRYDGRLVLNHLDVYRLDDPAETLDLDLPEMLESGVTVIEWGQQITAVLPSSYLSISLSWDNDGNDDDRLLVFDFVGSAWAERESEFASKLEVETSC